MYATLPASLKTELLVKSEVNEGDEEILKQRQELILSKSPSDLSEIRALSDFPIPEFVENLSSKIKTDGGSTINSEWVDKFFFLFLLFSIMIYYFLTHF